MSSTVLGVEKAIIFINDAHEKFYYEKLKEVRYQDVYHKVLVVTNGKRALRVAQSARNSLSAQASCFIRLH